MSFRRKRQLCTLAHESTSISGINRVARVPARIGSKFGSDSMHQQHCTKNNKAKCADPVVLALLSGESIGAEKLAGPQFRDKWLAYRL